MMSFHNIFLPIIISILSSLAVWRFYINWQYSQSTAGYRLKNIIEAMQLIIKEYESGETYKDEILCRYKHSLALPFYKMYIVYGLKRNIKKIYPLFKIDDNNNSIDYFKLAVWPTLVDINNNSFIGWLPGVPNVKRLLTIQKICFQIEKVTGLYNTLNILEKKYNISVIKMLDDDVYELINHEKIQDYIDNLVNENIKLHELWFYWIELIQKFLK